MVKHSSTGKQKYILEFTFESNTINVLWSLISTARGLSLWFADKVESKDHTFTFSWNNQQQIALCELARTDKLVRYRWQEENDTYFEFKIIKNELTNTMALFITDYDFPDEIEDSTLLWAKQIKTLRRQMGL